MKLKINNLIMYILIIVIGTCLFGNIIVAHEKEEPPPSGISFLELEEYIDDFADKHIGVETAGAAVSILQDGDIVFHKNYGYADIETLDFRTL
jgi:CubicO group peptidase (beta-lactamase class C family)